MYYKIWYYTNILNIDWIVTGKAGKTKLCIRLEGLCIVWSFFWRLMKMKIHKLINNNVLSAFDENEKEIVVMGCGIGFKAKQGEIIDETRIEKVFRIENTTLSRQFQDMLTNMPMEHMKISTDIIAYAQNECEMKLNQSIYVALTDHINCAIQRYREGVEVTNALLFEIRQYYHREYVIGEYALRLLAERLDVHFQEDEAGFIALHFVNALFDIKAQSTYAITNIIQKCIQIVENEFGVKLNINSMHYERFLTHLKFFARRVLFSEELLQTEEPELANMIEQKYLPEFVCAKKMAYYVKKEYNCVVTREETMYFAIHIKRVLLEES